MNSKTTKFYLAIPVLLASLSTLAHEGEEHGDEAQELDCSAMADMDLAKTNASDPVMQAMMMKCKSQLAAAELHASQDHAADNLLGDAHEEAAHGHVTELAAGDAHAHGEGGPVDAAVVGVATDHGHTDGTGDHGHGGDH